MRGGAACRGVLGLVLGVALLAPTPVLSQAAGRLRVEAELGKTRSGRPIVTGYVHNDHHGLWADRIHLLIEVLDGAGRVVARETGYVHGLIPPKDRVYFEASVPQGGASVRVTVEAFDWARGGGGGS